MNLETFPKMLCRAVLCAAFCAQPGFAQAETEGRTIAVRERAWAKLLDGAFAFQVTKIKGYSIQIKMDGARQNLKLGDVIPAPNAECVVHFEEILPETRIVHFKTDCQ